MGVQCSKQAVASPTPTPPAATPPPRRQPLRKDQMQILIDDGVDELDVASTEESYPKPCPPSDITKEVKLQKKHWFHDEEFQIASDDADLFETEIASDEISITTELSEFDSVPGKKAPKTKEKAKPKLNYDDVDAHAKKADSGTLESFEALVDYLTSPWVNDKYRLMKIARAIVVWMSQQNLERDYGEPSEDTPGGLMQYLKMKRMTYPTCYALLCRKAGVQCTIIKGLVKGAGYEPGDKSSVESNWNAVYCETGWQIVHSYWVCRALYGHNLGRWVKVEVDGKSMNKKETFSSGVSRYTFQEHYFMPRPEEFLYECYAREKSWQLVDSQTQIHNDGDFFKMPYLLPPFHGLGLQHVSEQKCELEAVDGFCKIDFKGRQTNAHMLLLQYELFRKPDETYSADNVNEESDSKELFTRMVFNSRANEHFVFEIRFPTQGTFKLVIYGGPYKSPGLRICEFKITCKQRIPGINLLPLSCENIGYGPGPVVMNAGLFMPSKPNGLIPVDPKDRSSEIRFQISDNYAGKHQYSAAIHGEVDGRRVTIDETDSVSRKNAEISTTYIKISITKLWELVLYVKLPEEGEYGVTIHENIGKSKGEIQKKTVCNYLVSTHAYKTQRIKTNVRLSKSKLAKTCAIEIPRGEDMKAKLVLLEKDMEHCRKQGLLDSDEDMCNAENMWEYLKCKDLLRDCHLRQNYHVTLRTLAIMARYKNRSVLETEIQKVEELKEELRINGGYVDSK